MIDPWQEVEVFADPLSAEVVAGLLRAADIPVVVVTEESLPGLSRGTTLKVPSELVRRARWTMMQAEVTEGELTFLATGRLGEGPADSATQ